MVVSGGKRRWWSVVVSGQRCSSVVAVAALASKRNVLSRAISRCDREQRFGMQWLGFVIQVLRLRV